MKRPLSLFAFTLVIGILLAKVTNSYDFIIFSSIFSLAVLLTFIIFSKDKKIYNNVFVVMVMLIFYIIGGFEYLYFDKKIKDKYKDFAGEQVTIKGTINSEVEYEDNKITCIILCEEISRDSVSFQTVKGSIRITVIRTPNANKYGFDNVNDLDYGDQIEVTGVLNIPSGMRNPGGFDYRSYLAISRVSAIMHVKEDNIISIEAGEKISFLKIGNFLRKSIVNVINNSLGPEQAGLLNGMLTGYRKGISKDIETAFRASGLSHILSVSGLHVAFIMVPFAFIFKKSGINRVLSNILITLILVFYIAITGLAPSVLRSVIMAVMILMGQIIWKEADTLNSLSLACIILLISNPHLLFSVGFQLSFAATLSIVLFNRNINKNLRMLIKSIFKYDAEYRHNNKTSVKSRLAPGLNPREAVIRGIRAYFSAENIIKKITSILSTTIAAQVGILPLGIMYFNEISIISVISNLLVAPFTGIIMVIGLIMAIAGHISLNISKLLGVFNNIFINVLIYISVISARIPFSVLKIGISSFLIVIIYYVLIWFFLWFKPKNKIKISKRFYIYSGLCITLIIFIVNLVPGQLEVTFLDVGSGDSIFIKTQEGKTILIDGGGEKGKTEDQPNTGEQIVIPFLLDRGVTKLDLVVASHGHADHIIGLYSVLEQLKVENVILPDYKEGGELNNIIDICMDRNIKVMHCKEGDNIYLDKDTYFQVFNPPYEVNRMENGESSLNNNSLVLNLIYKNVKMLFTGDIEKEAEKLLVDNNRGEGAITCVHVLKVPHHGSDTSSTMDFVEMVKPRVAVVSVGKNNYGHPSGDVLNRYENIGTKIYRTDINGAVIIMTNGKTIKVKVMFDNEYEYRYIKEAN